VSKAGICDKKAISRCLAPPGALHNQSLQILRRAAPAGENPG